MSQLAVQLQNKIVQDPTKLGQYMVRRSWPTASP